MPLVFLLIIAFLLVTGIYIMLIAVFSLNVIINILLIIGARKVSFYLC
jgi:hypothetical protein